MANLFITALPNGFVHADDSDRTTRISVVLNPELPAGDSVFTKSCFHTWPKIAHKLSWTVTFDSGVSAPTRAVNKVSADLALETGMWNAIFGEERKTAANESAKALRSSQFLSHDAGMLHQRNIAARLLYATIQMLELQMADLEEQIRTKKGVRDSEWERLESQRREFLQQRLGLLREYVKHLPVSLSVHPRLGIAETVETFDDLVAAIVMRDTIDAWALSISALPGSFAARVFGEYRAATRDAFTVPGRHPSEADLRGAFLTSLSKAGEPLPGDTTKPQLDEMVRDLIDISGMERAQATANAIKDAEVALAERIHNGQEAPNSFTATVFRRYQFLATALREHSSGHPSADAQRTLLTKCQDDIKTVGRLGDNDPAILYVAQLILDLEMAVPQRRQQKLKVDDALTMAYTNFVLFHWTPSSDPNGRRHTVTTPAPLDVPDFSQVIHLLQSYPALLRPLGLVIDLECQLPVGVTSGTLVVTAQGLPAEITGPAKQCVTAFELEDRSFPRRFFTKSRNQGIVGRLLKLNDPVKKSYQLVTEEADLATQKALNNKTNADRANEFRSVASERSILPITPREVRSTGITVQSPPTLWESALQAPAAAQAAQVTLLFRDQVTEIQATVTADTELAIKNGTMVFYAEDLILGHRVDVKYEMKNGQTKWYTLCVRRSSYLIKLLGSKQPGFVWSPETETEKSADEGFVSLAATSIDHQYIDPVTHQPASDPLTKVAQVLFNWVGSPLSIAANEFRAVNSDQFDAGPPPEEQQRIGVYPTYLAPEKEFTVPLQYSKRYVFRCRVVDLAGNSEFADYVPKNADAELPVSFLRKDPVDAPKIVLERRLRRKKDPGEQLQRMVLRDNSGSPSRVLVPPRKSLRLAELHGLAKEYQYQGTAFSRQMLRKDGSFLTVYEAVRLRVLREKDSGDPREDGDPIFITRSKGLSNPINPYLPDPASRFVRIVPFHQTENTALAVRLDDQKRWLPFVNGASWPEVNGVRVRMTHGPQMQFHMSYSAEGTAHHSRSPKMPTLDVSLPAGHTVILQVSSASDAPKVTGASSAGSPWAASLWTIAAMTSDADGARQLPLGFEALIQTLQKAGRFTDGSLRSTYPIDTVTLVHAVRKPLAKPRVERLSLTRAPGVDSASVRGEVEAHWRSTAKVSFEAHWTDIVDDPHRPDLVYVQHRELAFELSAPCDPVLDPTIDPRFYTFDGKGPSEAETIVRDTYMRNLEPGTKHNFRDTRAHSVDYTAFASTRFRDYYPAGGSDDEYREVAITTYGANVSNSVRPDPLRVRYIIPAFRTDQVYDSKERTWRMDKTVVLRIYIERPRLLSGNTECVAVVLKADKVDDSPVSKWGEDPTINPATTPPLQNSITAAEMTEANFQSDLHAGRQLTSCLLPSGLEVNLIPYGMSFLPERGLWYTDIRIDTCRVHTPFVQLALVGYQPMGVVDLADQKLETRCSEPLYADFIQVMPDRFLSIAGQKHRRYTVSVLGTFEFDGRYQNEKLFPIVCELQGRCFVKNADLGWRTVDARSIKTSWEPGVGGPNNEKFSGWRIEVELEHSAVFRNYRLVVREREALFDSPADMSDPSNARFRTRFVQFVDLP